MTWKDAVERFLTLSGKMAPCENHLSSTLVSTLPTWLTRYPVFAKLLCGNKIQTEYKTKFYRIVNLFSYILDTKLWGQQSNSTVTIEKMDTAFSILSNFFHFVFLKIIICVCSHLCECAHAHVKAYLWMSDDNLKKLVCFHQMGPRISNRGHQVDNKSLYLLSHCWIMLYVFFSQVLWNSFHMLYELYGNLKRIKSYW